MVKNRNMTQDIHNFSNAAICVKNEFHTPKYNNLFQHCFGVDETNKVFKIYLLWHCSN